MRPLILIYILASVAYATPPQSTLPPLRSAPSTPTGLAVPIPAGLRESSEFVKAPAMPPAGIREETSATPAASTSRQIVESRAGRGKTIEIDGRTYAPGTETNPWPRQPIGTFVFRSPRGDCHQGDGFYYLPKGWVSPLAGLAAGSEQPIPGGGTGHVLGGGVETSQAEYARAETRTTPTKREYNRAYARSMEAWEKAGKPGGNSAWSPDIDWPLAWRYFEEANAKDLREGTRHFVDGVEQDLRPSPPPPGAMDADWQLYEQRKGGREAVRVAKVTKPPVQYTAPTPPAYYQSYQPAARSVPARPFQQTGASPTTRGTTAHIPDARFRSMSSNGSYPMANTPIVVRPGMFGSIGSGCASGG